MAAEPSTGTSAAPGNAAASGKPPEEPATPGKPETAATIPAARKPIDGESVPADDERAREEKEEADGPVAPERRRRFWPSLALTVPPFAVTLAVMLAGIGDRQLWKDETATWWAASLTVTDLRKLTETVDVVLLPYYLVLHWWMGNFGDSETAMRVPSAIFMALAAVVVALIGRRLFGTRAGLVAGLLIAAVPAVSRYGQEARPYAMAMLATVTAVWLLQRALERPTVWRWPWYALAVAWIACSHVVALMSLAAHLALVLGALVPRGKRLGILIGWPVAVLAGVGAAVPLVLKGAGQNGQIAWIPDTTWERVQAFPGEVFMSAGVAGFFLVAGLFALVALAGRRNGWAAGAFALWTLLPPVLAYYTFHEFHFFYPRYLLFTVPAWALLAAYMLNRAVADGRAATARLLVATVLAGGALTFFGWSQQRELRTDAVEDEVSYRAAAAYIAERDQPGDGVVFTGYPFLHRGFRYYWRDRPYQPREILAEQPVDQAWNWLHYPCRDTAACLGTTERIWLISSDATGKPLWALPDNQQETVSDRFQVVSTLVLNRIYISELIRKPEPAVRKTGKTKVDRPKVGK